MATDRESLTVGDAGVLRGGRLAVYDLDLQSGELLCNATARDLWGFTSDEPVSYEAFLAGVHVEDRERVRREAESARQQRGRCESEYRVLNRGTGETRWVYDTSDVVCDASGQPLRLIGFAQELARPTAAGLAPDTRAAEREPERAADETARKLARETLAREVAETERGRLHTLLAQLPANVNFLRGPDLVFEFAHPIAVKTLGNRPLLGRKLLEAMPEHHGQPFYARLQQVYASGEPFSQREAEARLVVDGRERVSYWSSEYLAIRDDAGRIEGVMTFDIDVTDQVLARKQVEQARLVADDERRTLDRTLSQLAESRARADYAVRLSGVGFWYCDLPFDELAWDATVKEHFFLPPDTRVTIETFYDRIVPEDRAHTRAAIDASIREHTVYDVVYRTHDRANGRLKWIRAMGGTSYAADDTPIRFDGVTVDISKQKRDEAEVNEARAQAEDANRAKDDFLAMLGHELRNPLAPITTAVHLLKLRSQGNVAREVSVIERQSQHIARLVDDLLDVSRIARGKVILDKDPIEVAELIAAAIETVSPAIEQGRHALVSNVPSEGLVVDVDRGRMTQVFANLLANAAKYTPMGGQLTVTASRQVDDVVILVEDTGSGIAPELLPRVFDLFVQSRQTLERANGGLGLGLAIVKNLVLLHGGAVLAASAGLGRGSAFTVRLPAARVDGRAAPAAAPAPAAGPQQLGVLIVDDNVDGANMLAEVLDTLGYRTMTAYDAPGALRIAATFSPRVALLDVGLPVMDGYELALRLREQWPLMKLVAITGYGQTSDRDRTRRAGFQAHLTKPVVLEELAQLLQRLAGE